MKTEQGSFMAGASTQTWPSSGGSWNLPGSSGFCLETKFVKWTMWTSCPKHILDSIRSHWCFVILDTGIHIPWLWNCETNTIPEPRYVKPCETMMFSLPRYNNILWSEERVRRKVAGGREKEETENHSDLKIKRWWWERVIQGSNANWLVPRTSYLQWGRASHHLQCFACSESQS